MESLLSKFWKAEGLRRIAAFFLAFALLFSLSACGKSEDTKDAGADGEKTASEEKDPGAKGQEDPGQDGEASVSPKKDGASSGKPVVTSTTTFLNDMVGVLAGDLVERERIIPAGEDPHLYQAKPQDLEKLTQSDLVLYHGLHFEGKMVEALEKVGKEISAGFPADKVGTMDQDGEIIVDPHFWFDLGLYQQAVDNAAKYLGELLGEEKAQIQTKAEAYKKELQDLDAYAKEALSAIPTESRFLITPHDAFNYFSRAYDIPVMAPQGVSTDSEVATKDIQETVDFIVKNKVKAIFAESTTDPARMEKLQEACKAQGFEVKVVQGEGQELFSDSLAPAGQDGDTFLSMFRHNVDLIVSNLK